jgi:sortase A
MLFGRTNELCAFSLINHVLSRCVTMINKRLIGALISITLMFSGIILLLKIPYFYIHSQVIGTKLIKTEKAKTPIIETTTYHAVSNVKAPSNGKLIGMIQIPSLSLNAPILEGTTTSVLDEGAGHLTTSVMPGEVGTSIIAAHNVTWFNHVDQLKKGSPIQVQTNYGKFLFHVTETKIVKTGDPVYNTTQPSLVLVACYPLNALYLTPYRYLVFAKMDVSGKWEPIHPQKGLINYTANIPQGLKKGPLTLTHYSLGLGKLTYKGSPSMAFTESGSALSASHSLIQLYLAWLQASANKDLVDLQFFIPSYKKDIFFGQSLSDLSYKSKFNVNLIVQKNTLQSINATVSPVIKGHGQFNVKLTANVQGTMISLKSIDIVKISK